MRWLISGAVLLGTVLQFVLAMADPRATKKNGARWSSAEDELVAEQPMWLRRRTRRELKSWRPPDIHHEIAYLNTALASWLILMLAAAASLVADRALIDRAKAQGVVRQDLDQSDVIFIQLALSHVMESSRKIEPDLWRRYLTLFLDGIRTDRTSFTSLPGGPLSVAQTHAAMTSKRGKDQIAKRADHPMPRQP